MLNLNSNYILFYRRINIQTSGEYLNNDMIVNLIDLLQSYSSNTYLQ